MELADNHTKANIAGLSPCAIGTNMRTMGAGATATAALLPNTGRTAG